MKKNNTLNKGDSVRIIFKSYYEISKWEYNNEYFIQLPQMTSDDAMLGAKYKINDIIKNQWKVKMYQLEFEGTLIKELVPDAILQKDDDLRLCPFSVGDEVYFKPVFSEIDQSNMLLTWPFFPFRKENFDAGKPLLVSKIINEFYIFVNIKNGELIQFPMKWTDFVKKQ